MKYLKIFVALCLAIILLSNISLAQNTGDYRSKTNGNWGDASTWEVYDGTNWVDATVPPAGTSGTITIQSEHTITVPTTTPGDTVTINGANVVVNGYLKEIGWMKKLSGIWTINGTFEYAHPAPGALPTSFGLPLATWNSGSICLITGITSATTNLRAAQDFHHLTWDCNGMSGNLNIAWNTGTITIGGNLTVLNTGTGRLQPCAPAVDASVTVNINGNIVVDGTNLPSGKTISFTTNGTGNNNTTITWNIYGNITVIGLADSVSKVNFSISRGTQGGETGTGTTTFNLYGDSFSMSNATTQNSNPWRAKFRFTKQGTQTISFTNVVYASSGINFDVASGSTLQLNSNLNIRGTLNLAGGKINSSLTNLLIIGYWDGSTLQSGTVTGGSSTSFVNGPMAHLNNSTSRTMTFQIGKGTSYRPVVLSVTQAATTLTRYTAEMFNTAPASRTLPETIEKVSVVRHFKVTKDFGADVTNASITLNYDADDGVTDAPNLRIAKDDGAGTWVDLGGTGSGAPSGTITSSVNFTTFGDFVLANATGGGNPLPIQLASFIGNIISTGKVKLEWETISEINNLGFYVEKFNQAVNDFVTVSELIPGAGTTLEPQYYSWTDENAVEPVLQYRLKQVDLNGLVNYFGPIMLNPTGVIDNSVPAVFALHQNYPNPFNPTTTINFSLAEANYTTLKVYDILGNEVSTLFAGDAEAGKLYSVKFDGSSLSSGIYLYKLQSGKNVEVRKLMLMK